MLLTLDQAIETLIKLELITRDEFYEEKRKKRIGKKNCKILKRFVTVLRTDYHHFFPRKPKGKLIYSEASRLLRSGGKNLNAKFNFNYDNSKEPETFKRKLKLYLSLQPPSRAYKRILYTTEKIVSSRLPFFLKHKRST
jgi:hypothetical protein